MKRMKKLFAILMTMAMVMGLGITGFAAINGASITVKGLSTDGAQKVTIYELYKLDDNNNGWDEASWIPDNIDLIGKNTVTSDDLAALVAAVNNNSPANAGYQDNITEGKVIFSNLQAGAYLVIAEDSTDKVTYNAMIAKTYEYGPDNLIKAKAASVVAKASSWSTDKEIIEDENQDNVYQVGDVVKFQVTTTVPHNNGGETKRFDVTDILTNGNYYFSGNTDAVWNVKVGGVDKTTEFPAPTPKNVAGASNQQTFTLDLSSLLIGDDYAGQTVVITYTAKVNGQVDQITNTVKTSHDNDGDTVKAYTGQMTITKYGEKTTDDENSRPVLSGAQFVVYQIVNEGQDNEYRNYATFDRQNYVTGWIQVQNEDGKYTVPEEATRITTNGQGTATVKGLDVGEYYFQETIAPNGYSINTSDARCEITKTDSQGNVMVNGSTIMNDAKISPLPSTGGMGTTIFTIAGCVIMISAAGLFFASRRKAN